MTDVDLAQPLNDLKQKHMFFVNIDSDGYTFDKIGIK
jgi:hypothetical protein